MAKRKLDVTNLVGYRNKFLVSQRQFWNEIGVTQSGGSRFEAGRKLPKPVALLLTLRETGMITSQDLKEAMAAITKPKTKK